MNIVTKIAEHICNKNVKVQLWKYKDGYDIIVMNNGKVKTTRATNDINLAETLFNEQIQITNQILIQRENL